MPSTAQHAVSYSSENPGNGSLCITKPDFRFAHFMNRTAAS